MWFERTLVHRHTGRGISPHAVYWKEGLSPLRCFGHSRKPWLKVYKTVIIRHPVFFWQGKSGQGSKRNDLKNIVASRSMMSDTSLLIICMLAASPLVAIETEWPGLGVSECRNRSTCHVGEFCSLKSDIFGDCRNCTLLIQWCYQDFDYLRRNYPSCEATCERKLQ